MRAMSIWNMEMQVSKERECRSTRIKTSQSKEKDQQQTQPPYGVDAGI